MGAFGTRPMENCWWGRSTERQKLRQNANLALVAVIKQLQWTPRGRRMDVSTF